MVWASRDYDLGLWTSKLLFTPTWWVFNRWQTPLFLKIYFFNLLFTHLLSYSLSYFLKTWVSFLILILLVISFWGIIIFLSMKFFRMFIFLSIRDLVFFMMNWTPFTRFFPLSSRILLILLRIEQWLVVILFTASLHHLILSTIPFVHDLQLLRLEFWCQWLSWGVLLAI